MKKFYTTTVWLVCLLLQLTAFSAYSQAGWDLNFHRTDTDIITGMAEAGNGDLIVTGTGSNPQLGLYYYPFLARLNAYGDTLWVRFNFIPGFVGAFNELKLDPQGNIYAIAGLNATAALAKFDPSGNLIWFNSQLINPVGNFGTWGIDLDFYANGDLFIAGQRFFSLQQSDNFWARCNPLTGDTLWTKINTPGVSENCVTGVEPAGNDEFIMIRHVQGMSINFWKVDAGGNILLDTLLTTVAPFHTLYGPNAFKRLSDGTFAVGGGTQPYLNTAPFMRFDAQGDSIPMDHSYANLTFERIQSITEAHDGNIVAVINMGVTGIRIAKYTPTGQLIWRRDYPNIPQSNYPGMNVILTQDHGFLIGSGIDEVNGYDYFLMKTDSSGLRYTNRIEGKVYLDLNGNCQFDNGELPLANRSIMMLPDSILSFTDSLGNYILYADSGAYTAQPALGNNYYFDQFSCPNPTVYNANFTANNYQVSTGNDFGVTDNNCHNLWVDISNPILRICTTSYYTVQVCNYGYYPESNIQVNVQFDTLIDVIDSLTIPGNINGLNVTATIPSLQPNECISFRIYLRTHCNINVFGRTSCAQVSISPDNDCWFAQPGWDQSIIGVDGECNGNDTVRFRIRNFGQLGTGDMSGSRLFTIYEDNILMASNNYLLPGGDSLIVEYPINNGSTVTLRAQQHPAYPFGLWASDAIEACGPPTYTLGWLNTFGPDDLSPGFEEDCNEIVAAYDPNDKTVTPKGYTADGFIDSTQTQLQYKIRFQNTGTDTAFNVYIIDTLPPYVNPSSLHLGSASHPYTMEWVNPGVIKFMFYHIMLPDSNVNEPLSHGFAEYRIDLFPNLAPGTRIENRANIFFDYNPAVITNYAVNTINNDVLVYVGFEPAQEDAMMGTVYPNPFSDQLRIKVEGLQNPDLYLEILDLSGKTVYTSPRFQQNEILLETPPFGSGLYIYRLYQEGTVLQSGKLVKL